MSALEGETSGTEMWVLKSQMSLYNIHKQDDKNDLSPKSDSLKMFRVPSPFFHIRKKKSGLNYSTISEGWLPSSAHVWLLVCGWVQGQRHQRSYSGTSHKRLKGNLGALLTVSFKKSLTKKQITGWRWIKADPKTS